MIFYINKINTISTRPLKFVKNAKMDFFPPPYKISKKKYALMCYTGFNLWPHCVRAGL